MQYLNFLFLALLTVFLATCPVTQAAIAQAADLKSSMDKVCASCFGNDQFFCQDGAGYCVSTRAKCKNDATMIKKVVGCSSVVDPVDPVAQSAFTAISVRRSIEVAKVILNVVSSLEESDQEPSEEGYLSALEEALAASCDDDQEVNRNAFQLEPKEQAAIQNVDGHAMIRALSEDTTYEELKNDQDLQNELDELVIKYKEMSSRLNTPGMSLLEEDAELGWAAWTKIGVWTAGIALAVPTFGVSLGVASGVNIAVSVTDISIKGATGDFKGATASSVGMLVGALIPGGGVLLDSGMDAAADVGLDLVSNNIDEIVVETIGQTINVVQNKVVGKITGDLVKKSLGLLQVDEGEVEEVVSLKDYRKAKKLHAEIKQRRRINKCYFDYIKRRDAVEGITHKKLPKNLHLLKKIHREEKALASIWKNYKKAFAGDVEKLTNEFDVKLATCRDSKNKMAGLLIRGKANLRKTKKSDVTRGKAPLRSTKSESDLNTE